MRHSFNNPNTDFSENIDSVSLKIATLWTGELS